MIKSGRGVDMGDGWETARNPNRPSVLKADSKGILQVATRIMIKSMMTSWTMMNANLINDLIFPPHQTLKIKVFKC